MEVIERVFFESSVNYWVVTGEFGGASDAAAERMPRGTLLSLLTRRKFKIGTEKAKAEIRRRLPEGKHYIA